MAEVPESRVDDFETIQFYGIEIATPAGICQIMYRNASNGYYGGNCEFVSEFDNSENLNFRKLIEDYAS